MSRPFILVSLANNGKALVRLAAEGGAVDVYRLTYGRWEVDQLSKMYPPQLEVDPKTTAVKLVRKHITETGVLMDRRDAKRMLAKIPPPWVVEAEAWDATDEANGRDDAAAKDLEYQRAEQRELKGE